MYGPHTNALVLLLLLAAETFVLACCHRVLVKLLGDSNDTVKLIVARSETVINTKIVSLIFQMYVLTIKLKLLHYLLIKKNLFC